MIEFWTSESACYWKVWQVLTGLGHALVLLISALFPKWKFQAMFHFSFEQVLGDACFCFKENDNEQFHHTRGWWGYCWFNWFHGRKSKWNADLKQLKQTKSNASSFVPFVCGLVSKIEGKFCKITLPDNKKKMECSASPT